MRPGELRPDPRKVADWQRRSRRELERRSGLRRRRRHRISGVEAALALTFWDEAMRQGRCAGCGHDVVEQLQAHHVIPQELLKRLLRHLEPEHLSGILWDYRNSMALCEEPAPNHCHSRHTNAFRRVPRSAIRPCVFEFASELDALAPGHLSEPFTLYLEQAYPEAAAA